MKKILLGIFLLSNIIFAKEIILVQGAMDMEVDYLVKALHNPTKKQIGSWVFWKGKIKNIDVVVSRTEVGLVNASAATTIGIMTYHPTLIINQGTSGGHDPKLHQGDIVLGTKIINIGSMRTEKKEVNKPANYKDWIFFDVVQRLRDKNGNKQENPYFESTPKFVKMAKNIKYKNGKVVKGTIGSADEWNREIERINYLHKKFNTSSEEMETVATAQVAKAFYKPFIAIRILSNSDLHNQNFNPKTALWCQEYTLDLIKKIGEQK